MKGKRLHSGAVRVLEPGTYDLITPGHDVPAKEYPRKCAHCFQSVKAGETWRDHFNGQYHVLYHVACEVEGMAA